MEFDQARVGPLSEYRVIELGEVTLADLVPKFLGTLGRIRHSAKPVGYDAARVLTEICGYDVVEVSRLEADGVVKCLRAEDGASG